MLSDNLNENETIVTIRLPKEYYRSVYVMAHMLGYSLEEYVNRAVKQKIVADLEGAGELDLDTINHDLKEKLLA